MLAFRKRHFFGGLIVTTFAICLLTVGSLRMVDNTFSDLETAVNRPQTNQSKSRILLVSALYPLEKSKHSQQDYREWLRYFLGQITTDVYFFAPPSLETLVQESRSNGYYLKLNASYPSAFSTPPLQGKEDVYREMHGKDRERVRHSPELYSIWNAKPFFLNEAVREMRDVEKRDYDYAFWVDAGSFRNVHAYERWPDSGRVDSIFSEAQASPDSIFIPIYGLPNYEFRRWREELGPVDDEVSEGSFFGGSSQAIAWYTSTFYAYHDHYLSLGHFVGKDQTLINSLLLLFPKRFITLSRELPISGDLKFWTGRCTSYWYYYEYVLSSLMERRAIESIWEGRQSWGAKTLEEWVLGTGSCPLSQSVSVDRALLRAFGPKWRPANSTIVY